MADTRYLDWPFFEPRHRELAQALDAWAGEHVAHGLPASASQGNAGPPQVSSTPSGHSQAAGGGAADIDTEASLASSPAVHGASRATEPPSRAEVDATCRRLVRQLGAAGWLQHAVPATPDAPIDTRAICLIRETLARHNGLADFAFAMQGLGSGAISLHGTPEQRARYLPRVASGEAIAAFALSEPEAGSDVAAMACSARAEGSDYILDGEKTWISNGGIADFYVVFARTGEAPGARGISAFIVDADTPGFEIAERIDVIAPHPLARLRFNGCRIPASQRIGEAGQGFKIAMRTLDVFRTSVAAAALGFARCAFDHGLARATGRRMFGGVLGDFQLTQTKLAQMATQIDSAALLTYRAAWLRDQGANVTREAAMAKLTATENAQQVIDAAVQLWGGLGVVSEQPVERLYREIRALRIYEGASEVQQLIIGRDLLREAALNPVPTGPGAAH